MKISNINRFVVLALLIGLVSSAVYLQPHSAIAQGGTETPTPSGSTPDLPNAVIYWDMGIAISYPDQWAAPTFTAGQLLLAPPGAVVSGTQGQSIKTGVVALRLIDPVKDYKTTKDAALQEIALLANLPTADSQVNVAGNGLTTFAGLDAVYVNVEDPTHHVIGQTIVFILPDGRYGVLVGIAPQTEWASFSVLVDAIRASASLVRPSVFNPTILNTTGRGAATFPEGGISFTLPDRWSVFFPDANTRQYHDSSLTEYSDDSGYVNGPQLVINATAMPTDQMPVDAFKTLIGLTATDAVYNFMLNGQAAVQYGHNDENSGQLVVYTAFTSRDGKVLIILRWTTPAALTAVTRPAFDAILASIRFGDRQ